MRSFLVTLIILVLAVTLPASGVRAAEEAATDLNHLKLGVLGSASSELLDRVHAFAEAHTGIPIQRIDPIPDAEKDDLHDWFEVLDVGQGSFTVYLYAGDTKYEPHILHSPSGRYAIVNLRALYTEDQEVYLRRVEKLFMRSIGLLLEVPLVPNPHSAMWTYQTLEDLDIMGRNFDPPSLLRLQQNAKDRGIAIGVDSPFSL